MSHVVLQDAFALLIAGAFGFYAFWKQIGAWGNIGVFVLGILAMNRWPQNEIIVVFLIAGAVFGVVAGIAIIGSGFNPANARTRPQPNAWQSAWPGAGAAGSFGGAFEEVNDAADDFLGANAGSAGGQQTPPPPVAPQQDYYAVLGVERTASEVDIKRAYRKRIKTCHPDLFPADKEKEALAQEINQAYDVLSDPQKRAAFDHCGVV